MTENAEKPTELPNRKTERLRKGRLSIPNARYFLTFTTQDRQTGLAQDSVAEVVTTELRNMHRAEDISLHYATIMPDHIHLLFTLGKTLSVSQIVRKFKTHTKAALAVQDLQWQANFFEHRLRLHVSMNTFARYIFLNPYRKHLLPLNAEWPYWILNKNERPEFSEHLVAGKYPQPAWLQADGSVTELIENSLSGSTDDRPT